MESRKEFENRICEFAKENFFLEKKFFKTRESVEDKVNSNNQFIGYYGDTIVFDLNSYYKERIDSICSKLYKYVPECFCERLKAETMHITLHDLSSAKRSENVVEAVQVNEQRINQLLKFIKVRPSTIRLKTHYIANILNISLVLVFFPESDEDYLKLMTIYRIFDGVRTLDYKLTPHVTLGYYNINGFNVSSVWKLENLVNELNKDEFEIAIRTEDLFYQHFTSMNDYRNIIKLF